MSNGKTKSKIKASKRTMTSRKTSRTPPPLPKGPRPQPPKRRQPPQRTLPPPLPTGPRPTLPRRTGQQPSARRPPLTSGRTGARQAETRPALESAGTQVVLAPPPTTVPATPTELESAGTQVVLAPPPTTVPATPTELESIGQQVVLPPPPGPPELVMLPIDLPPPDGGKTKRAQFTLTASLTNSELAQLNVEANRAALKKIYDSFYKDGKRLSGEDRSKEIYKMMGNGTDDYVRKPVEKDEVTEFLKLNQSGASIRAQNVKVNPGDPSYEATMRAQVAKGNYFHVHNHSPKFMKAHPTDRMEGLGNRARRIIVNVNSQQAGLKVAEQLGALMDDDLVSPNMREFKIYLTEKTPKPGEKVGVKHDKLVVYYRLADGTKDGEDPVGDKIVKAINGAVTDDDIGSDFAPFYARIGPGVAWAEEPKYFVGDLDNSFTTTRAGIISKVIKDDANAEVDEDTFVQRVGEELRKSFVDPDAPHRHLPGARTLDEVRADRRARQDALADEIVALNQPVIDEMEADAAEMRAQIELRRRRTMLAATPRQRADPAWVNAENALRAEEDADLEDAYRRVDEFVDKVNAYIARETAKIK